MFLVCPVFHRLAESLAGNKGFTVGSGVSWSPADETSHGELARLPQGGSPVFCLQFSASLLGPAAAWC